MNHLAHFHLSWPREDLVVGALEGDYHRGPLPGSLNPTLVAGVALHRAVDGFTDSHPLLADLRRQFPADSRRYAGIMVDLCFDHYLSLHWSRYCDSNRESFCGEVYAMLRRGAGELSEGGRRAAGRLEEYDVLGRYDDWHTVIGAADRVGQRLRRANPLHRAGEILEPLRADLETAFLAFYPELVRFASNNAKLAPPLSTN